MYRMSDLKSGVLSECVPPPDKTPSIYRGEPSGTAPSLAAQGSRGFDRRTQCSDQSSVVASVSFLASRISCVSWGTDRPTRGFG